MILLAEHDEPSLAAKKKRRHVALETATSTPKNRVWNFENSAHGRPVVEPQISSETATGSVQFSYETASGRAYYYTRDHLGSIREMLNMSGAIVARYDYDPYGRSTKVQGATNIDADFQYCGYYEHATSGLNLTLFRAYDSNTARWLSRDPIAEHGGTNLYAYVNNNPVNNIDLLGLLTDEAQKIVDQELMQNNGNFGDSLLDVVARRHGNEKDQPLADADHYFTAAHVSSVYGVGGQFASAFGDPAYDILKILIYLDTDVFYPCTWSYPSLSDIEAAWEGSVAGLNQHTIDNDWYTYGD